MSLNCVVHITCFLLPSSRLLRRKSLSASSATRRLVSMGSSGFDLIIKVGDITKEPVDAIVNAASEHMEGGGGVDDAIHRAAGPKLLQACKAVPMVSPGVRCPTGEARLLPGFDLPAKYVIATVGPVFQDERSSAPLLRTAYRNTLKVAAEQDDIRSVAFPAISCGVYGYPVEDAAKIALMTVVEEGRVSTFSLDKVLFTIFSAQGHAKWLSAARDLGLLTESEDSVTSKSDKEELKELFWRKRIEMEKA